MDLGSLRAESDPSFDRLARIVREAISVPVALVSIVEPDRQVFPGAVGLPEPWQESRQTPLSHSFCQYVVADAAPLIISDARTDDRLRSNLAIPDLGVVAYAGFPLIDAFGTVIGSVCAIDNRPRDWTDPELRLLADVAAIASVELELRESRSSLARSVAVATELSTRARLLLSLSEALAEAVTDTDVAAALQDVAAKQLDCNHAGIWIVDVEPERLRYVAHPQITWPQAERHVVFPATSSNPLGEVVTTRRPQFFPDRATQDARYPHLVTEPAEGDGQARAILPLTVGGRTLGALALLWAEPRAFSDDDRISIAALTSYTGQAVQRAALLADRAGAARTLQQAMMTQALPRPAHLTLAARYLAAGEHDEVGGDWYDAVVTATGVTQVTIGDVQGHDLQAAAAMGALRNMLRTLAWAGDASPARTLERLECAARDLGVPRLTTVVFGEIATTEGGSNFRWSNAGHLPPVVMYPDGTCVALERRPHDLMMSVARGVVRRDHSIDLPPGSTLLLYTDGLVETRTQGIDAGVARLLAAARRHRGAGVDQVLDLVLADLVDDDTADDVALLAVHVDAISG